MTASFPKEKLEEIKSRADIIDVISEYVTLKKIGKNYQALCPFHSEKTPSFNVNEEKQVFYCFGCQKGGDVITFLKEINNISFVEAVKQLSERYGISLPTSSYKQEKKDDYEALIRINEKVAHYYHRILIEKPEGEVGRAYLNKRGMNPDVWETFKLGYAPERWDGLVTFLSSENIPLKLVNKVGLISSRKDGGFFDYFRGRIIFPIFSLNGKTIGFGGRATAEQTPKYLNSSESVIYKKRFSLFGLPITRNSIRDEDRVFLVEGYFDLLSLYQAGICSVAAPLGTALTSGHIQTLKRYTANFYIAFDADTAGEKASLRSLELFLEEGLSPKVLTLPPGTDPDDLIRQIGPKKFKKKIEDAPFLIDYYMDKTIEKKDISNPYRKEEVIKTIMPILNHIGQPIIQDEYIHRLAEKLMVREDRIRSFKKSYVTSKQKDKPLQIEDDRREIFLLTLMLQKPVTIPVVDKSNVIEDLGNSDLKGLCGIILETFRQTGTIDLKNLLDNVGEKQRDILTGLSIKEEDFGDINNSLKDCICQVKRSSIKKMQVYLTQKIKKAQGGQDESEIRNLNKQKIQLSIQEKNLNNTIGSLLNL